MRVDDNLLRLVHQLEHGVEFALLVRSHLQLLLGDLRGGARKPSEVKRQVAFEIRDPLLGGQDALDFHRAVGVKVDAIEAAKGRAGLVLRAHGLLKQVLLHMDGLGSQSVLVAHLVLERIEAEKQSDGERGAGAQTGPRRQVGDVVNLHPFLDSEILQAGAHGGVLNLVVPADILDFGIGNTAVILKKRRQPAAGDVAVLVDRGGQYRAPVLAVPNGVVSTPAKKRNPEWSAGRNHVFRLPGMPSGQRPRGGLLKNCHCVLERSPASDGALVGGHFLRRFQFQAAGRTLGDLTIGRGRAPRERYPAPQVAR